MASDIEACFLLRPSGPLRFGIHPDDLTPVASFPSSDTVFGALAWAMAVADGEAAAGEWVSRFAGGNPPVLVSSALPYEEGSGHCFLPRPQRRREDAPSDGWDPKVLKRTRYVDLAVFSWFRGGELPAPPVEVGEALVAEDWARAQKIASPLWKTVVRPGVALDRTTSASQVYGTAFTFYRCSLAIYVLGAEEEVQRLETLFDVLALTGMGGKRSRGAGSFRWQRIPSPLPLTSRPVGMSLSLLWPRPDELETAALSPPPGYGYRLVQRGGWISSPVWSTERSRTVVMLGEGSHVNPSLRAPVGGLADVTPTTGGDRHPVFRYGLGLFLDEERLT